MSAHTAGPWQIKDDYTPDGRVTIIANIDGEYFTDDPSPHMTYDTIAVCEDEYGERLPNAEANARLIAFIPELLDALREAERFLDYFANGRTSFSGGGTPRTAHDQVRAAIAKALGEPS